MKIIFLFALLFLYTIEVSSEHLNSEIDYNARLLETNADKLYVGYYPSWASSALSGGKIEKIATLPAYINVLILSFMFPDAQYTGNLDISATGLQFTTAGSVLKDSITALKKRNPNTKVMVAVGGATYTNWAALNETAIVKFVKDFGLDGVDVDYEPLGTSCKSKNGSVSCTTDSEFISVVTRLRKALPSPYLISIAADSIAGYGYGNFTNSKPVGSHTGQAVNMLLSPIATSVDWVNIMGYNGGSTYDPTEAFLAFNGLLPGKVVLGVQVPPEPYPGHTLTLDEVDKLSSFVSSNGGRGMMIWNIRKIPTRGPASPVNPNPQMISDVICTKFGLAECGVPIFN